MHVMRQYARKQEGAEGSNGRSVGWVMMGSQVPIGRGCLV